MCYRSPKDVSPNDNRPNGFLLNHLIWQIAKLFYNFFTKNYHIMYFDWKRVTQKKYVIFLRHSYNIISLNWCFFCFEGVVDLITRRLITKLLGQVVFLFVRLKVCKWTHTCKMNASGLDLAANSTKSRVDST